VRKSELVRKYQLKPREHLALDPESDDLLPHSLAIENSALKTGNDTITTIRKRCGWRSEVPAILTASSSVILMCPVTFIQV
jgi:hypothetical protein